MTHTAVLAAIHSWGNGGVWWFPFAFLFWLMVAGALVFLIVRVRAPHAATGIERARDTLAERLARGEIEPEEYYERMSALS